MLPPSLHLQRRSAIWGIHPTATVPSFSCRLFLPRSVWRKQLQGSSSLKQELSPNLCFFIRNPVPLRRKKSAPFLNPPLSGISWQTTRCLFSETTGSGSMRAAVNWQQKKSLKWYFRLLNADSEATAFMSNSEADCECPLYNRLSFL